MGWGVQDTSWTAVTVPCPVTDRPEKASSRASAAYADLNVWDFVGLAILPLLIVGLGSILRRGRWGGDRSA